MKDPESARKVLERYVWDGDLVVNCSKDEGTGQSCLEIYGYEWPGGWHIPEGTDRDHFEIDYDVDAADGFQSFLKEIAPFLDEPLTVQAVGSEKCRFPIPACEWHVRPGATTVDVNGFVHGDPRAVLHLDASVRASLLVVPSTIDWSLLANQKKWLLGHATTSEEAAGLVHLLDVIQDAAVDRAGLPETVFFPLEADN